MRALVQHLLLCVCVCACPSSSIMMQFLLHWIFSPLPLPVIVSFLALAAATLLYLNTRPGPLRPPVDLHHQTLGIKVGRRRLCVCAEQRQARDNVLWCRMAPASRRCWRTTTT